MNLADAQAIPGLYPPKTDADRAALLQFVRKSPLVYGYWKHFKRLFKQAEQTGENELLAAQISRMDRSEFSLAAQSETRIADVNSVAGITVQGSLACINTEYYYSADNFFTVDISDPLKPRKLGSLKIENMRSFVVQGDHAYVVVGGQRQKRGGLQVVSLSNPSAPRFVGVCDFNAGRFLHVEGNYAYVKVDGSNDGPAGFRIIDVSVPSRPTPVGYMELAEIKSLEVSGHLAYLAVGAKGFSWTSMPSKGGLQIVDVRDLTRPHRVGFAEMGDVTCVTVSGRFAYLLEDRPRESEGTLHIVDVSDSTRPVKIAACTTARANRMILHGNFLYLTTTTTGPSVVDVSDPTHPQSTQPPSFGWYWASGGLAAAGSLLFGAAEYHGLRIADLSNPAFPAPMGAAPSQETIGYMKRRARRVLRTLAKTEPQRFVDVAFRVLSAMTRKQGVNLNKNWVAVDILFGGSGRYQQAGHGRRGYRDRQPSRFQFRRREERAPDAWNAHPQTARRLLTNSDVPWQAQEMALRILLALKQPIPALSERLLTAFLESKSLLLQTTATRQIVTSLESGNTLDAKLTADTFCMVGAKRRKIVQGYIERQAGMDDWETQFIKRLYEKINEGLSNDRLPRRLAGAAALLAEKYPLKFAENASVELTSALYSSGNPLLMDWALTAMRNAKADSILDWLEALENVPEARRELALAALQESMQKQAFDRWMAQRLIYSSLPRVREAGWLLLAGSETPLLVLSDQWNGLLDADLDIMALSTALASPAALSLLSRIQLDPAKLLARLQEYPQLISLLTPVAFEGIIQSLPFAATLRLIAAAPADHWHSLRESLLNGLRKGGNLGAFWMAAMQAIPQDASGLLQARLLDDPLFNSALLNLDDPALLDVDYPPCGPLLQEWAAAHAEMFAKDSELLLKAATHALQEVRDWGLNRAHTLGMSMPFALRLLESGVPPAVAEGKTWFESISAGDTPELEYALALCDSPQRPVREYGQEYITSRRETLPFQELLNRLEESSDPWMQAFVAQTLRQKPEAVTPQTAAFDRQVLRARDRGRRAKELVKARRSQEPPADTELLLEVARSRTGRDAEWALSQLARLALEGEEVAGLTVEGSVEV